MKTTRVSLALGALLAAHAACASAQSARSLIRDGNGQYDSQKYGEAELNYRKALERERDLVHGHFNLGDALHRQGKYDEAVGAFQRAAEQAGSAELKASAHYNIGNTFMKEEKYREAINAYIDALKLNPQDQDAKFNLSYALKKLREQQQQQQQQQQDKQDKNKKQQQQQQQQNQDQERQQQNRPQEQRQMSKAEAQRILEVLKNSEREIQKKLRVRQAVRPKTEKDW